MTSDQKKKSMIRRQSTAAITPGLANTGVKSGFVKGDSLTTKPDGAVGRNLLAVTAPPSGPPAPEDTLIDVDAYGDGMSFRFTWR